MKGILRLAECFGCPFILPMRFHLSANAAQDLKVRNWRRSSQQKNLAEPLTSIFFSCISNQFCIWGVYLA